jgi:hypothetical protein
VSAPPARPKSTIKIPKLDSLMNAEPSKESAPVAAAVVLNEPFTPEQLKAAWMTFAEKRKLYQAEYHLLTQEYEVRDNQVIVQLYSPLQETMLNTMKSDIATFLRDTLRNSSIQVVGQLLESSERKVIYTNREKFDHLAEKNPALRELRDRLGLDTDF